MAPDYPLLGLLARKPASGYDLGKWLTNFGLFLGRSPSMSPIYRSLNDLHERGWISYRVDSRDSAPDAKIYSLTPAGREALTTWANSEYTPAPRPMSPDFIVRLSFAGQLGPETALKIVKTELAYRRAQRKQESGPGLGVKDIDPIPEIDPAWLIQLEHLTRARGWQSTSWFIGWLETTAAYLEDAIASSSAKTEGGIHVNW